MMISVPERLSDLNGLHGLLRCLVHASVGGPRAEAGKRVALACLLERRVALSPLRSFTATSWLLAPDYVNAAY